MQKNLGAGRGGPFGGGGTNGTMAQWLIRPWTQEYDQEERCRV